jgi:uncharacterized protein YbjT (DUF2867 family)
MALTFVRVITFCVLWITVAGCTARGPSAHHAQSEQREGLVLVAGGSGRAGIYVVRRLKEQGTPLRAMTRSLAEARGRLGPEVDDVNWVETDVRDATQAEQAMQGVTDVICVIGSRELAGPNSAEFVDYGGVKNLVDAALRHKVRHFTLLTAIGATDKESFANKMFKGALEWRFKGEEHLRASGLTYTVVRPAGLTNEPAGTKGVKLWQGDEWKMHLRKTISRDDLAMVLIETLRNPGARNATFEITNEPSEPAGSWKEQMGALTPD